MKNPIQLELPLTIKGNSIARKLSKHRFYGFKNRDEFLKAVRLDRAFKHLQQRGKSWN